MQGESNIPVDQRLESRTRMVDGVVLHVDLLNALIDARKAEGELARTRARQYCYNRAWGTTPISKERHYARNGNQLHPWSIASNLPQISFKNVGETPTHNIRTSGNIDWRGRRNSRYEGWQVVYDSNGMLVTDPINLGTYDYSPPLVNFFGHIEQDITPWIEWKNSTTDTSTRVERLAALYKSGFWFKPIYWYWKDLYGCLYDQDSLD